MRAITSREWASTPDDYRSVIDGQPHVLANGGAAGTVLVPVQVYTPKRPLVREQAERTRRAWVEQGHHSRVLDRRRYRWRFRYERFRRGGGEASRRCLVSKWFDDYFYCQAAMYTLVYEADGNTKRIDNPRRRYSFANFQMEKEPRK